MQQTASRPRRVSAEELLATTLVVEAATSDMPSQPTSGNPSPACIRSSASATISAAGKIEAPESPPKMTMAAFREGVEPKFFASGTECWLERKGLDDADADAIVSLILEGRVKTLQLAYNELTETAACKIAHALEDNTTLTALSLHCNRIGPDGGLAFARVLERNTTLTSLYLSENLTDEAAEQTIKIANEQRRVPLSGFQLVLGTAAAKKR